jgi:hypothetical protein
MKFERIEALIAFIQEYQGNELFYFDFGLISPDLAEHIRHVSGLDVSEYFHIVDNYSIRHALERHGNAQIELSRGQVALENDDFALIPHIVSEYDHLGYEFARQKHTLIFEKTLPKGNYVYAAEVRMGKRRRICSQSLRILRIKKAG